MTGPASPDKAAVAGANLLIKQYFLIPLLIRDSYRCSQTRVLIDFPLISADPLQRSDGIKKLPRRLQ